MQSLWLLIPLFLFILLILPILFEVRLSYNIYKNMGTLSLKLWFIRIKLLTFKIKGKNLIIRTKKNAKQIEISLAGPEIKLLEQFSVQIKDKIKVKKLEFHSKIGTGDAFQSAMLSAGISIIVSMVWGYIKNQKDTAQIGIVNHTEYKEKVFQISLLGRISISIFDTLYSFIMASIIVKKSDSKKGYVSVKN